MKGKGLCSDWCSTACLASLNSYLNVLGILYIICQALLFILSVASNIQVGFGKVKDEFEKLVLITWF